MCQQGVIKEAVPALVTGSKGLVHTQLCELVMSLWKAVAEVALDQKRQKSRRKAGCDVGGQTGTLKDKWDPYFSLASSNLVYKHKAGTLYHRPGHMLCLGPRIAEGEELAGTVGAVGPHQQGKPADG